MIKEQIGICYARLGQQERVRFLLELSQKLTVIARETYFQGEIKNPVRLISINEFEHRLCRMALDVIDGTGFRTDTEVAEYLFTGFKELGAINVLEDAVKL